MSAPGSEPVDEGDADTAPPPISFWVMIGLAVLYLGWRLVQGIMWLIDRVF